MPLSHLEPDGIMVTRGAAVPDSPRVSIVILVMRDTRRLEACLRSIRRHVPERLRAEVVVLANGSPLGALTVLQMRDDIVLIRSPVNHGFGGGCNWAARFTRGERLVFLNDDAQVTPGWLESLDRALDADPLIASAGSRVVFMTGRLQEAGSVIWRDGTTTGIGRDEVADAPEHLVRRDVDYTSACSMMVRRQAFEAVGGYDERYYPAYYEDADLCLELRRAGWRVVYEPRSVIRHHESASTRDSFRHYLFLRNQRTFVDKWGAELRQFVPRPLPGNERRALRQAQRRSSGVRPNLLIIDDCEPDPALGAGFGRMYDAVLELSDHCSITFVASYLTVDRTQSWLGRRRHRLQQELGELGVELRLGDVDGVVRTDAQFDAAVISRPTNYEAFAGAVRGMLCGAPLIYDAESFFHRRLYLQAAGCTGEQSRRYLAHARRFERIERDALTMSDAVVCISEEEAAVARGLRGDDRVVVVPVRPATARLGTTGFSGREPTILFTAGWLAGSVSPNLPAVAWTVEEVLPLVREAVPWVRLLVTGADPPTDVQRLGGPSVAVLGLVDDLDALYDSTRVAISPMLAGAGVKIKTVEALLHGVPTVATTVGAEGIDTQGTAPMTVTDDPKAFAEALIGLLTDRLVWERTRAEVERFAALHLAGGPGGAAGSWWWVIEHALRSRKLDNV